jgi:hypothetical protein
VKTKEVNDRGKVSHCGARHEEIYECLIRLRRSGLRERLFVIQHRKDATIMAERQNLTSGITNAPLKKEQAEQAKVPHPGESTIGKGQNRKPSPP